MRKGTGTNRDRDNPMRQNMILGSLQQELEKQTSKNPTKGLKSARMPLLNEKIDTRDLSMLHGSSKRNIISRPLESRPISPLD